MPKKKKKPTKKAKTYVCVVCGDKKSSSRNVRCCSKSMVAKDKGTWNG